MVRSLPMASDPPGKEGKMTANPELPFVFRHVSDNAVIHDTV